MKKAILVFGMVVAGFGVNAQSLSFVYQGDTLGYYTGIDPQENKLVLTEVVSDSLLRFFNEKISFPIEYTSELDKQVWELNKQTLKNEKLYNISRKNSQYYLTQAGKYKNLAVAITSVGSATSTILLLEHPANAPSAAVIGGLSSITGYILNIIGNNALIKAGLTRQK
jgi:hypothetical protein